MGKASHFDKTRKVSRVWLLRILDGNDIMIITPHVSDMTGVIVLTSSVCVLPLPWPNGQMYRLEFWHGDQVEGYLGQVRRSRS